MVFVGSAATAQLRSAIQLPPLPARLSLTLPAKRFSNNVIVPSSRPPLRISLVDPAFSTAGFGFFCRQELRLEKTIKLPLRFRLGSVTTCDRLEGKRVSITQ